MINLIKKYFNKPVNQFTSTKLIDNMKKIEDDLFINLDMKISETLFWGLNECFPEAEYIELNIANKI